MSFPFDSLSVLVNKFRELNEPVTGLPSIAPVAVVADYTRRTSTEEVEARGLMGFVLIASAPNYSAFQIYARTRAVVVESISLKCSNPAASYSLNVSPWFNRLALDNFDPPMQLGGIPTTAACNVDYYASAAAGDAQLPAEDFWTAFPQSSDLRLFVPKGWIFSGQTSLQNTRLEGVIVFHEVIV